MLQEESQQYRCSQPVEGPSRRPGLVTEGPGGQRQAEMSGDSLGLACDFRALLLFPLTESFHCILRSPFPLLRPRNGLCTLEGRPLISLVFTSPAPSSGLGERKSAAFITLLLFSSSFFKAKCSH